MFQKLVSHNDDLRRLVEKGYAVAFDNNCLIVRDIPYLGAEGDLHWGALVAKLVFVDQDHVRQDDHQILFAGGAPHNLDGKPIANLGGGATRFLLSDACSDVPVERSFSNKPLPGGKFPDFFAKVESYATIIAGPAVERHGVTPLTFRAVDSVLSNSVFRLHDTMTSRAGITDLAAKFLDDVVAIIGLGGTGCYVLDFLVKTPVREIRAFDFDDYFVHNAFRSPGRLNVDELGKKKAEIYQQRYENFRTGLSIISKYIDSSCEEDLEGVTFAFVCVDRGSSRSGIIDLLISKDIPFIDVGMGLNRRAGALNGMLRTTYFSRDNAACNRDRGLVELGDRPDDLYNENIQISELNALNASLAVVRFKQLRGFYVEEKACQHFVFSPGDLRISRLEDDDEN